MISVLVLIFVTCQLTTSFALELTPDEQRMFDLINEGRTSRGLSALQLDEQLVSLARAHSLEMVTLNYFGHISPVTGALPQRLAAAGVTGWNSYGENIAGQPSVDIAYAIQLESPSHLENILNPAFTHLGVGIVPSSLYGLMITEVFLGRSAASVSGIRGRVIDQVAKRMIPGTCVRINDTIMPTNANGNFRFTLVHPGTYTVYYDAPGYISQTQVVEAKAGLVTVCPTVIVSR